ncbi:MAG: hypothetical protein MK212_05555 [Saprospiraceae bacterium]|nr:hypothetical protein [Saprospiraceae bacterium]
MIRNGVAIIFGILMIIAGVMHVINPEFYDKIIPSFIPNILAHAFALITEVLIGIALLVPNTNRKGGIGFMLLMLFFMPLHIWELFKEEGTSLVGSTDAAIVRIVIQVVLIGIGWWIWRGNLPKPLAEDAN